jgi:hypothetical protein
MRSGIKGVTVSETETKSVSRQNLRKSPIREKSGYKSGK